MNGVGAALSNMESSMKKVSFSRSPLKDLNGSRSSSSSSSQTRGCLGFFSSKIPHHHHHHHPRHRTPKSAPNPTRVPKQLKPPPLLKCKEKKKRKKKKKMTIHICSSRMANMGSDGESLQKIKMDQQQQEEEEEEEEENSNNFTRTRTPPGKDAITPPIQASISPEIQIGGCSSTATATATATYSSIISTTPAACFAAGHLLSGVTDKRKCRPRGILAVPHHQDHNNLGLFSTPPSATADTSSSVPSPAQASMHWLLSPPSPLNPYQEENARESFSCDSNFSTHNLFSTPPSHYYYSSSEYCLPFSCFNTGEAPLVKFDSLASDPVDVLPLPAFSFHLSDSTTGPLSNAGTHSWREGLASRMFEMDDDDDDDEFDCCQWLSEDEKDHFNCNFDSDPMLPRSASKKPIELQDKKAVSPPATPINPCAESITTDGGGLLVASSTDSDWTLSYKNNLFKS